MPRPRTPGPGTASACRAPSSSSAVIARRRPGLVSWCSAQAARRVGDLVVVLEEGDERAPAAGRAPGVPRRLLLPAVALALVQEAVLRGRDELLRRARGSRCSRPRCGRSARPRRCGGSRRSTARPGRSRPARGGRTSRASCGSFSATTRIGRGRRPPRGARGAISARMCSARRRRRCLGGVEAQAVEVELVDPVAGVRDEELAHRPGVRAVEVERLAPLVLVAVGEVVAARTP